MTTKAEFRDLLRRALEDTSVSAPLWDDATLDDATAEALARYGALVPFEQRSSVIVAAATALRRRAVEEAKRGGRSGDALLMLALQCERDGERLARNRGRQVHGSIARKG